MTKATLKKPLSSLKKPLSYAVGLALAASLAACEGSSGADAAATRALPSARVKAATQTPTQKPTQAPTQRTTEPTVITITGREVAPAPSAVNLAVGQSLTLLVTSDHDNTLHAHGLEVEKVLVAGTQTTVTLTGKTPGSYEVETHDPELRLLVVNVR